MSLTETEAYWNALVRTIEEETMKKVTIELTYADAKELYEIVDALAKTGRVELQASRAHALQRVKDALLAAQPGPRVL